MMLMQQENAINLFDFTLSKFTCYGNLYVTWQPRLEFSQQVRKNRDPRFNEEFNFMLEEPPKAHDRLHVEVVSTSSRMGLLHPKVQITTIILPSFFFFFFWQKIASSFKRLKPAKIQLIWIWTRVYNQPTFQKLESCCWFNIYLVRPNMFGKLNFKQKEFTGPKLELYKWCSKTDSDAFTSSRKILDIVI